MKDITTGPAFSAGPRRDRTDTTLSATPKGNRTDTTTGPIVLIVLKGET
ncbi:MULTISPECIES: hypothetical protein [unclassified Streptosporangium]|nr:MULTISPECIES: hypothetical protein [unclassified Streptosporangium]